MKEKVQNWLSFFSRFDKWSLKKDLGFIAVNREKLSGATIGWQTL